MSSKKIEADLVTITTANSLTQSKGAITLQDSNEIHKAVQKIQEFVKNECKEPAKYADSYKTLRSAAIVGQSAGAYNIAFAASLYNAILKLDELFKVAAK